MNAINLLTEVPLEHGDDVYLLDIPFALIASGGVAVAAFDTGSMQAQLDAKYPDSGLTVIAAEDSGTFVLGLTETE